MDRILDLPPAVRMGLFAVVAVLVCVLGWFTLQSNDPAPEKESSGPTAVTEDEEVVVVVPQDPASTEGAPENEEEITDPTEGVELELVMPVKDSDVKIAAGRAARFTELYQSYRFDQNKTAKQRELGLLLASDHMVDLGRVFPTGPAANALQDTETVIAVDVNAATVTLVSAESLSFTMETTITTTAQDTEPVKIVSEFAVVMSYDPGRAAWYVSEFLIEDGSFQDEQPLG